MPTLNKLECSIELAQFHQKLHEYGISYGDGVVETYVAVPSEGEPFAVHLTSNDFIADGLAMYVFIDGKYQCNRNRQDLVQRKDLNKPLGRRNLIDFRVRQKEERHLKGTLIAREWTFSKLNVVSADKEPSLPDHVVNSIGCIEVVVVRCAGRRDGTSARPGPTLGLDGTTESSNHHFGLDGSAREFDERNYRHHNRQRLSGHRSNHQPTFRSHEYVYPEYVPKPYIPDPPPYTEHDSSYSKPFDNSQNSAHDAGPSGTVPHRHSEAYYNYEYPKNSHPFGTDTIYPRPPAPYAKYESQGELFHQRTPDRIPQHESLGVSDYVARITREAYERAEKDIHERVEREHRRAAHVSVEHGGHRREAQPGHPGAWPHPPFAPSVGANINDQHNSHWGPNASQTVMQNIPVPFQEHPGSQQIPDQPVAWGAAQGPSNNVDKSPDHWTADRSSTWNTGGLDSWNTNPNQQQRPSNGLYGIAVTHTNGVPPAPFFENQVLSTANDLPSSHTGHTEALYNRARSSSYWRSESENGWRSDDGENTWPDTSSTWARSEHAAIPPVPTPLKSSIRPNEGHGYTSRILKAKRKLKQDHLNWNAASESGWATHDDYDKTSVAASGWTNDTIGTAQIPAPPIPQFGAALPERLRQRLRRPPAGSPPPYPITPVFARAASKHSDSRGDLSSTASDTTARQSNNFNGWDNEADTWGTPRDKEDDKLSQSWGTGKVVSRGNTSHAKQKSAGQNSWGEFPRGGVKLNVMPGAWDNSDPNEEANDSSQHQKSAADAWGPNDDGNNNVSGWTQEDNGWITSEDKQQDSVWPHHGSNEQSAENTWGENDGWNNQDNKKSEEKSKTSEAKQDENNSRAWGADNAGDQSWGDSFGTNGDDQNTPQKLNDKQGDGWAQTGNNADTKDDRNDVWPDTDANKEGDNQTKNDRAGDDWQNQDESSKQVNNSSNSNGWNNDQGSGDKYWDKQDKDACNDGDGPNNWSSDANNQETTQQPHNSWGQNTSPAQQDQTWGKDSSNQQEKSWEDTAASIQQGEGWGNDNANNSDDPWPQKDQSQAKAASWNNDGGADNQSVASTTKSRLRNYQRLRKPAHLQPQPHWNFPPPPPGQLATIHEDSESMTSGVVPRIHKYKETPLLAVPESKAKEQCLDHQVQEGKGIEYEHCIGRPRYLDTLEKPYAVFRFRYRSQAMLHKLFPDEAPAPGHEPPESASVFQQRINTMSKDELKALLTRNWQKQQGSGDHERVRGWVAEQSKKGSKAHSVAHGSATDQQKPASKNGASWGNTARKTVPEAPSARKPADQKAKSNKATSNAGGGWGDADWGQDKAPTEKAKSTKAASNSGGWGQDAFASNGNGDSWGNENGPNKSGSKKAQSQGGWGNDDSGNNDQAGAWKDDSGGDTWGGDMKTKDLTPAPSIKGDWAGGQGATGNVSW